MGTKQRPKFKTMLKFSIQKILQNQSTGELLELSHMLKIRDNVDPAGLSHQQDH